MKSPKIYLSNLWQITKKTAKAWVGHDPFAQSSLVGYYAIFSIPALCVIIIALAGLVFGREAVQGELSNQISGAMGEKAAEQIEEMVAKTSEQKTSVIATILGVLTLIIGSTGVFAQLQSALNTIWGVKIIAKKKFFKMLKDRLFSFGLVISIGFLMLVSLLVTTGLEAFNEWIKAHLPDFMVFVFKFLNFIITFCVISVLFALIFKILPDAQIRFRDVWVGAMLTTLLFILGKFALGIYFAKADPVSAYGAAGSVVLIMLWVSYSCMILFFGAEFTKQYTVFHKHKIVPRKGATIDEKADNKSYEADEAAE